MTKDRDVKLEGYYKSHWPVECGGNRRQKAANGRLDVKNKQARVQSICNERWNVMTIFREREELFLGGTMPSFTGPPPFGWVQKIDPQTLEVINETPRLPCGEHVWCGAIAAHQNGNIIKVNGNYMHSITNQCEVDIEKKLPIDQAHNGLLVLSDGSIVTKDLRLEGQGRSTITRLNDKLELMHEPFLLPEGSMGRIASDKNDDGEFIYIPGIEKIWKIRVDEKLSVDGSWSPTYRSTDDDQGLSWDGCISDGSMWLMNNGDIDSLRAIYSTHPNGRFNKAPKELSWRRSAPWSCKQRLYKFDLYSNEFQYIEPFEKSGGGIIAPPVNIPEHNVCVCWDSINGGLAGIDTTAKKLDLSWKIDDIRPTMQPVVFPESEELVINSFEENDDKLVVIDLTNGNILDKVSLKSPLANGMFLTPGLNNDIFYCTTRTIARVSWT